MAADESLFKALDIFTSGVQQFQLQRSLTQANDAVTQIKQSDMKEAEQMKQIRGVANDLTMRLAGQGVNAATIEQVGNAFKPQQPTAFEQNVYLQQLGAQSANQKQTTQNEFTAGQSALARENALKVAGISAAAKAGGKDGLKEAALKDLNAIDTNSALINSILNFTKSKKVTPGLGNVGILGKAYSRNDPDYAFLENKIIGLFNEHRKAVTGAAAGPEELDQLRAEFPGMMNSPKQFEARLKSMLDTNNIKRKVFLGSQKANKKDVSAFMSPGSAAAEFNPTFEQEFLPPGSGANPASSPEAPQNSYEKFF